MSQRRVVDLEDRAGVIAEVPQQAEVELDAVGDAALVQLLVGGTQAPDRALDGIAAQLVSPLQHRLGIAAQARQPQQRLAPGGVEALDLVDLHLQADQVVRRELIEDALALLPLYAQLGQQLAEKVGVAEPDHGPVQPDGVERGAQHLDHLGGALGRARAQQLDPGVHELAHLGALRAHRPVGVADVGEAQRHLGLGVAARRHPRDRHGHVRAQRQQLAALVEEAIGADAAAPLGALQHLVVLECRGRDLPVAAILEDVGQGRLQRAQLAHLVREDVPGARGDRVDHRPIMAAGPLLSRPSDLPIPSAGT